MGLFDFLTGEKKIKELSNEVLQLKQLAYNERFFQNMQLENLKTVNQNIVIYPKENLGSNPNRYSTTDDIYSIIQRLAKTSAQVPIYGYLVKDEKAKKQLNRIRQPHNRLFETKQIQIKALVDLDENDRVEMLLEDPSTTRSKFEFFEAVYSFLYLFGEAFILKERPQDGKNAGLPVSLHILYPQHVLLRVTQSFPRKIVGYNYIVDGHKVFENLPPEDVIHIKYFNPNMDFSGSELRGLSPLTVLAKRLFRMDSSMDTAVAQLKNGGVTKIIFDKALANIGGEEAVEIIGKRKDNYYRFNSNSSNAGTPYFASGEMGVIDVGSSINDLSITELAKIDFKKLCNAYGISDRLFNNDATGSEISDTSAHQGLYTDAVLHNVYRVRDALKAGLLDEFENGRSYEEYNEDTKETIQVTIKGDKVKRDLREDLSEISVLQEDMLSMAQWMALSPHVTYNERRLMMKFDRLDNPIFDEPLIPTGVQLADDLIMVEPIETDLNGT